jgi:hypothetical protein
MKKQHINAILMIYHHQLLKNAATIDEHIDAFCKHSKHPVLKINSAIPLPRELENYTFSAIVLHYSLFGLPIRLGERYIEYIRHSDASYKIAFFQDEYRFWAERAEAINRCKVNCVYTLIEPPYFDQTYRAKCPGVSDIIYTIPGYVPANAREFGEKYFKPEEIRTVDVGYRGRRLSYYMGRGAQEKHFIGVEFQKRAEKIGLVTDIETEEKKRIYGEAWPRFIANCKAVLGVEAGVSVFDLDGSLRRQYGEMCGGDPDVSFPACGFDEVHDKILAPYEDKIFYRTISPRHFEAASLRVCQILFRGKYSGILEPERHYIPLEKDFSNFDEVIDKFKNAALRKEITANAYNDLIASGNHTYEKFIAEFDKNLARAGIIPRNVPEDQEILARVGKKQKAALFFYRYWALGIHTDFPGREWLKPVLKPFLKPLLHNLG